ncbi:MAG: ABC transporter permease [Treponema sp.]|jgi:simple sugar transport system permease protein|nr:ABC transporter permease [Treponema sp.]
MTEKKPFNIMDYFSAIRIFAAILISLLIVFIIIFFVADDPWFAISRMMLGPLQTRRSFFNVIERAGPLIFTGLALNVALRSGIFNIASDSAFYIGAVLAAFISLKLPLAGGLYQIVYLLAALVVGGGVNTLPLLINKYTGIAPTVVAIMQNSIFYYVGLSLVSAFLLDRSGSWGSRAFPPETTFGNMISGTSMHWGFLILAAVIVFVIFLMEKSSYGYKVRLTGINKNFARSAGIKTGSVVLGAQFIGGSIAGMGGAIQMMGMYRRFQWQLPVAYVWDGLLVHMLANQNPAAIPLSAFFIAYLRIGAEIMSRTARIDPEVVAFLQGIVIMLVASDKFLYGIKRRHEQKQALAQAGQVKPGPEEIDV